VILQPIPYPKISRKASKKSYLFRAGRRKDFAKNFQTTRTLKNFTSASSVRSFVGQSLSFFDLDALMVDETLTPARLSLANWFYFFACLSLLHLYLSHLACSKHVLFFFFFYDQSLGQSRSQYGGSSSIRYLFLSAPFTSSAVHSIHSFCLFPSFQMVLGS
jgi:hypothetical protein